MANLDLGVIGNCAFGALIDARARYVWCCLPRFDGDPVFNELLNGTAKSGKTTDDPPASHGFYAIEIEDFARSEQSYLSSTAILVTRLYDDHGGGIEITDFAPRFAQLGRMFRPTMIVRIVRPIDGAPRVRIRLRPACEYGATAPHITHGSNHIRYVGSGLTLRLTTNAPLAYVLEETPFHLQEPLTLVLGPDETFTRPIHETGRHFFEQTRTYWRYYARQLAVPLEWQDVVTRAAITLKLCSFEETGAIVAAMTTSIPESPDSGRNWDYRFCWLRDAFFVVRALNRLSSIGTMEDYLKYLINVISASDDGRLQPVYGVGLEHTLDEREITTLSGYRGMKPVRAGNAAYAQVQHDAYGSAILAAAQAFFDRRLLSPPKIADFVRLEAVGERAFAVHDQPDAGMWELRTQARVHTSSSLMCWAACDRLAKIATRLADDQKSARLADDLRKRAVLWRQRADQIARTIAEHAFNAQTGTFVDSFDGDAVDAGLLLMPQIGFLEAKDRRFAATVDKIEKTLLRDGHVLRYAEADDFGVPEVAFNVCTFWYIEALAGLGRMDEARDKFEDMLGQRNPLGLLSEDIDPKTGELWGNYPQTYSMVGLIHCAMVLTRRWETVV